MAQVGRCHLQNGQNVHCRMPRDEQRSLPVYASAIDHILRWKLDVETSTAGRSSMGLYHHHHHQEERESTPFRRSVLDCNSYSAASVVLRNDFGLQGNAGTNTLTRSQNFSISSAPSEIECFDDADISAACMLMEMSNMEMNTKEMSSSDLSGIADEDRKEQPCSIIRVSDFDDRAASASPPVAELSEMVGTEFMDQVKNSSPRATDDEVGTVQEIRAPWATYSSGTSRPRIELRTLGKKRVKPRKDERELNVFGMNQEVSATNKYDILDRPTRKRHYKSLNELLGIK